jgi:outer membrane lipoprotein-sorting protein
MKTFFTLAFVTVSLMSPSRSSGEIDSAPVKKWIARQASVDSFYSEFEQERQLRALKKPLINHGKLWFEAPGSFRWQIGDPPEAIAIQNGERGLVILNPEKRTARRYTMTELREEERARGASFLESGFPRSWEQFDRNFKLTEMTLNNDVWEATVSLRDRKTAVALRKMVFYIDASTYDLRGFYLRFRDSSSITTRLLNTQKNPVAESGRFEADLRGYEIEEKKAG